MQRWSEHVRHVTGDYPQIIPGQIIDLTDQEDDQASMLPADGIFGPGESMDVDIPDHLLKGGGRHHDFDWR